MLVRNIGEHVLIVGIRGQGIHSLFEMEEMPKEEIVMRCARLLEMVMSDELCQRRWG